MMIRMGPHPELLAGLMTFEPPVKAEDALLREPTRVGYTGPRAHSKSRRRPDVERTDDLSQEPACGAMRGDTEERPVEHIPDRSTGRRVAPIQFDPIRPEAEVSGDSRTQRRKARRAPFDRHEPGNAIRYGRTDADDGGFSKQRSTVWANVQLEVTGKPSDPGLFVRYSLA